MLGLFPSGDFFRRSVSISSARHYLHHHAIPWYCVEPHEEKSHAQRALSGKRRWCVFLLILCWEKVLARANWFSVPVPLIIILPVVFLSVAMIVSFRPEHFFSSGCVGMPNWTAMAGAGASPGRVNGSIRGASLRRDDLDDDVWGMRAWRRAVLLEGMGE